MPATPSPTSTRGAARTAARLVGALGAALAAACSEGADEATGEGAVSFAPPLGPAAGVTLSVTPGSASVDHVEGDDDLLGGAPGDHAAPTDRVTLRLPVTVTLSSYGLSAAGADDPFLDEAAEVSAALALLLRDRRTLRVGETVATVEPAAPLRAGFAEDPQGSDRFTAGWTTALSWTVSADRLPELAAPPGDGLPTDLGEPFLVEASTS